MDSLWGIFTKSIPWRETKKVKALPMGLGALRAAQPELLLGTVTVLFTAGVFAPRCRALASSLCF